MGLLNDTMGLTDCDDYSGFMNLLYFDRRRKSRVITHQEYLRLAEAEYCNLYWAGKWTASRNNPVLGFFVDHGGRGQYDSDRGGGCGDGDGGQIGGG